MSTPLVLGIFLFILWNESTDFTACYRIIPCEGTVWEYILASASSVVLTTVDGAELMVGPAVGLVSDSGLLVSGRTVNQQETKKYHMKHS